MRRYRLNSLIGTLLGLLLLTPPAQAQSQTLPSPRTCIPAPPPVARFGINVAREGRKEITDYNVAQLPLGWYLDYTWHLAPADPNGMRYYPMIRRWRTDADWQARLAAAIAANPGSLWILGNEPDHQSQDNRTPDDYATFYHTVYTFLKEADPTSRVAIGAITQATPIRLRYLEAVLHSYQTRYGAAMPVDVWTVHGYILPEVGDWGVGLPPGLTDFAQEGKAYTIADHGSMSHFVSQLRAFRHWMASQGYADRPLILSEFGILLAPAHGYPDERVIAFLQESTQWLATATDPELGYAADGYRLVQEWAWFSLNYYALDPTTGIGQNGNLLDHQTGQITPVGQAFREWVPTLTAAMAEPVLLDTEVTPPVVRAGSQQPLTVTLTLANRGHAPLAAVQIGTAGDGNVISGGQSTATVRLPRPLAPQCADRYLLQLRWTPPLLAAGQYSLQLTVGPVAALSSAAGTVSFE